MNPIAVVLDTSAVLAYADGQVAVGELLTMVAEDGRLAAVPASCVGAARAAATDEFGVQQVARLTRASAVAVLPSMPDDALEVGRLARAAGGDLAWARNIRSVHARGVLRHGARESGGRVPAAALDHPRPGRVTAVPTGAGLPAHSRMFDNVHYVN